MSDKVLVSIMGGDIYVQKIHSVDGIPAVIDRSGVKVGHVSGRPGEWHAYDILDRHVIDAKTKDAAVSAILHRLGMVHASVADTLEPLI